MKWAEMQKRIAAIPPDATPDIDVFAPVQSVPRGAIPPPGKNANSLSVFADPELEQWRKSFAQNFGAVKAYAQQAGKSDKPLQKPLNAPFVRAKV